MHDLSMPRLIMSAVYLGTHSILIHENKFPDSLPMSHNICPYTINRSYIWRYIINNSINI